MNSSARAVVIGGGVVGLCSAYYLARRGCDVTLLERAHVGAGSSWGNAGLIVPSHSVPLAAPGVMTKAVRWMADPESPFFIRPRLDAELARWLWLFARACTVERVRRSVPVLRDLSRASLVLHREIAALPGGGSGLREEGLLYVYRTDEGLRHGAAEADALRRAGIDARVLGPRDAMALEGGLAPGLAGAVHYPEDAHLVPDRLLDHLAHAVAQVGATILTGRDVIGFTRAGGRITAIETTRGDVVADEVVLAAGAWSPVIIRELGVRLPVQAAKGYSVTAMRPATAPRIPLVLGEARVAVSPMDDRLRLAGTLELAGLDLSIARRRVDAVRRAAGRYLRCGAELDPIEIWRGLRPCSPDGLPIIGRPARIHNLTIATGHGTLGVSLGPITGQLVAEIVTGEKPSLDVTPLGPNRF